MALFLVKMFCFFADVNTLVYDVTQRETFTHLSQWLEEVQTLLLVSFTNSRLIYIPQTLMP